MVLEVQVFKLKNIILIKLCIIALSFISCDAKNTNIDSAKDVEVQINNSSSVKKYKVEVFCENNDGKFGYEIFENGRKIIRQSIIPSFEGNNKFASKEDALKVGELMIFKIQNGNFPPTVTNDELDSLGIKKQ